ncbi:hypothetical protein [Streptomyces sp. NPDC002088]|uniref:hypothetical protein n=1 Tax=Streptomyces sp. NPDC002088 TaxID=3154665 RepID=UPI00332F4C36
MEPDYYGGWFEEAVLVGGQKILAHPRKDCIGRHCAVHNPSEHHMSEWRQNFRSDRALTERVCMHGVGHPDPDDLAYKRLMQGADYSPYEGLHGCDGCCR